MSYGRPPPRIEGMVSLKVDNLTYRTTPEDLRRVFERCGEVGDVYIPRDRFTRESRGFAFVRFYDKRDAEDALDAMDGRMLDGRELRVQMARYGRPTSPHRRHGRSGRRRSRSRSRRRSTSRTRRRRSVSHSRSPSRSRSRSNSKSSRGRSPTGSNKSNSKSRSRSKSRD
ncbi:serine/arginine-rich splicing factor 2 [Agrilus planipennis]|uniref:Serine/arginine-rich splicing factor 2 n=1 Tax=Agrilus planipennis TaxID=224129 RepID=A0A7F5RKQ2_AGRPL|nr:serine/arginine-rich splicing factor 2 [Agrilus planipennis]